MVEGIQKIFDVDTSDCKMILRGGNNSIDISSSNEFFEREMRLRHLSDSLLDLIENTPCEFKEVILNHLKLKGEVIITCANTWLEEAHNMVSEFIELARIHCPE